MTAVVPERFRMARIRRRLHVTTALALILAAPLGTLPSSRACPGRQRRHAGHRLRQAAPHCRGQAGAGRCGRRAPRDLRGGSCHGPALRGRGARDPRPAPRRACGAAAARLGRPRRSPSHRRQHRELDLRGPGHHVTARHPERQRASGRPGTRSPPPSAPRAWRSTGTGESWRGAASGQTGRAGCVRAPAASVPGARSCRAP